MPRALNHAASSGPFDVVARGSWGVLILVGVALAALHGFWLVASLGVADVAPALAGFLLGALLIDGLTGLVHWACDTWGDEHTPWVGPGLIAGFREHHRTPQAMLAHDWITVNREPAVAASLALVLLTLTPLRAALLEHPHAAAFLWSFIVYGGAANQLHLWAHAGSPPLPVRALQRAGLVLTPRRHARHHRPPRESGYCISTGWLNPLLDSVGFWRALERGVTRLTGASPRA